MKVILRIVGIIAACIGIYFSVNLVESSKRIIIPDKFVYVSSSSSAYNVDWSSNMGAQYLGGDAYNYMVEASLKAGYYNATVMRKTVIEIGGTMLLFFSIFFLLFSLYSLQTCISAGKQKPTSSEDDYHSFVLQHLQNIEDRIKPDTEDNERKEPVDTV